uniref:Fibronectin type-III domain-containing protein n=1 Tax=Amphimedon queenslandica TaxID=400682 RepID=A0A1X7T4D2_AMPQE
YQQLPPLLLLRSTRQLPLSLSVGLHLIHLMLMDMSVVNVTSDTDTVQTVQVEGSSNNTITLNGLRGGTTYSITVRAYQQLL